MGYKPNLVTIAPSRTRTVPSKSVNKTGIKRTTKFPAIPTDTFNYSSLENRGIAVYNPVTGQSQYATTSPKKPVSTSSSNIIPFYPGKKIDTIPQSSNINTVYSKSTSSKPSSNNTPGIGTALTLMGVTGGTALAMKYLGKKYPGTIGVPTSTTKAVAKAATKKLTKAAIIRQAENKAYGIAKTAAKVGKVAGNKALGTIGDPIQDIRALWNLGKGDTKRFNEIINEPSVNKFNLENQLPIKKTNMPMAAYGGTLPNKGFGDVLGGAASGALTGTTVLPGWGTAIGAVVGGVSGFFKGKQREKQEALQQDSVTQQNELQLAQQKRMDNAYMANYKPIQMNSMYAFGGDINNPPKPKQRTDKQLIEYGARQPKKAIRSLNTSNVRFLPNGDIQPTNPIDTYIPPTSEEIQRVMRETATQDSIQKGLIPLNMLVNKANGGQINNVAIPDKNAIPINGKAEIVVNNQGTTTGSHETGQNIPVTNEQGQQTANVEPGEVVMTTSKGQQYALSSRLGFAEKYQMMNDMIDKANARLKVEKDLTKRTTIERNIDKVKRAMDMLPQQQEVTKQKMGIVDTPQKGWGDNLNLTDLNNFAARKNATDEAARLALINGNPRAERSLSNSYEVPLSGSSLNLTKRDTPSFLPTLPTSLGEKGYLNTALGKGIESAGGIGNIAQIALPFITNAINNRTLNKSMEQINKLQNTPIKYNNLDDKVDVSAQIGQVNNSYRDAVQGTRGVSDSRTAASMKGEFAANRIGAINPILENASNTSRGIRNQNVSNINTLNTVNAQRNDELSKYKLENQVGLNNAKIAGRNQAVDNIYQVIREKNMSKQDQTSLGLLLKTYNENGVMTRQLSDLLKQYGIDPSIINAKK